VLLLNTYSGTRCTFHSGVSLSKALMPSRFQKLAIEPERIQAMRAAFNKACAELGLSPTPDRLTEIVVTKIILCLSPSEIVVRLEMAEEPAKFLEYARACRETVARMPDAQAKQTNAVGTSGGMGRTCSPSPRTDVGPGRFSVRIGPAPSHTVETFRQSF
jgi:hypothetical protein